MNMPDSGIVGDQAIKRRWTTPGAGLHGAWSSTMCKDHSLSFAARKSTVATHITGSGGSTSSSNAASHRLALARRTAQAPRDGAAAHDCWRGDTPPDC
jgi:hypothetical protein